MKVVLFAVSLLMGLICLTQSLKGRNKYEITTNLIFSVVFTVLAMWIGGVF